LVPTEKAERFVAVKVGEKPVTGGIGGGRGGRIGAGRS
jgi:hypothetical protein